MKNALRLVLISLVLTFALLLAMAKDAGATDGLNLSAVTLDYGRFINDGTDALIYPHQPKEVLNLKLDLDVLRAFYWDNAITAMTDTGQFRAVGWEYNLGLRLFSGLSVQYHHRSQHVLDDRQSYLPHFPFEDTLGFSLKMFSSPTPRGSLF